MPCEGGAGRRARVERSMSGEEERDTQPEGETGAGCRAGRAPEESELEGQQEGGSGGLPAAELEGGGLVFLHAGMAVRFACLWKSSSFGRQGGCFSLVGEAGGSKGKEQTGGEEHRGQGGQLEKSFHDPGVMSVRVDGNFLFGSFGAFQVTVEKDSAERRRLHTADRYSLSTYYALPFSAPLWALFQAAF